MKWIIKDIKGTEKTWYSGDVIEKIQKRMRKIINAGHCNNCDGCGYFSGCDYKECGTYQAYKVMDLIKKEGEAK